VTTKTTKHDLDFGFAVVSMPILLAARSHTWNICILLIGEKSNDLWHGTAGTTLVQLHSTCTTRGPRNGMTFKSCPNEPVNSLACILFT
jgi:hypothetical protein